jgi:hypothetical protein
MGHRVTGSGLSDLCVECGLCCDGSLFRFLPVEPAEVETYRALALPVVTQSGRLAMPLPCAKLEARCCTIYKQRPPGCRAFVCHLGRRLELGDVTFPEALTIVHEARRLLDVLRVAAPGAEPVLQRATSEGARGALGSEAAWKALEATHAWLDEHIHWPEGPQTGV